MSKARPGMVGFSNNKKGWLPKLIRFFTQANISHTLLIQNSVCGDATVQEASNLVQVVPFKKYYQDDDTQQYWLYEISSDHASPEEVQSALKQVFDEFAGVKYGYFQLVWFPWRWFCEKILRRDVRKTKNWMTDGVICSELVYWFLYYLGPKFRALLVQYNPDTIQAEDIRRICEANPKIFRLVEYKLEREIMSA